MQVVTWVHRLLVSGLSRQAGVEAGWAELGPADLLARVAGSGATTWQQLRPRHTFLLAAGGGQPLLSYDPAVDLWSEVEGGAGQDWELQHGAANHATVYLAGRGGRLAVLQPGPAGVWQLEWTDSWEGGCGALVTVKTESSGPYLYQMGDVGGTVGRYSPLLGVWGEADSVTHPGHQAAAVALTTGQILLAGGTLQDGRLTAACTLYTNTSHTPDRGPGPASRPAAPLPAARAGAAAVAVEGNRVYLLGGETGEPGRATASVCVYQECEDRWEAGPAMLQARVEHSAAVAGPGWLVVVGGRLAGRLTDTVEMLCLASGCWHQCSSLPAPRAAFALVVLQAEHLTTETGGQATIKADLVEKKTLLARLNCQLASPDFLSPPAERLSFTADLVAERTRRIARPLTQHLLRNRQNNDCKENT